MQSIQQMVSGSQQAMNSGLGVASSLTKPRAAVANTTASAATGSTTSSTSSSAASTDDSSTITANDFLTLLVAEMKNQDPTTPTDPTQYISQMVDVNSLQQLIAINQGISSLDTATGSTGSTSGATGAVTAANPAAAAASGTGVDAMLAGSNGAGTDGTGTSGTGDQASGMPTWLGAASGN